MNNKPAKYSQVFPIGETRGLSYASLLKARRKKHLKALDSFALFAGVQREPGSENLWIMSALKIYQEPSLMYLTGLNQTNLILVLNPQHPEKEVLFIPEKDPKKEFWDGFRFGWVKDSPQQKELQLLTQLTGIAVIKPLSEFNKYFRSLCVTSSKNYCYTFFHEYKMTDKARTIKSIKTDHNWKFAEGLKKSVKSQKAISSRKFRVKPWASEHYHLRLPLDDYQVLNVKKATAHTNQAYQTTLKKLKTFKTEHDLANFLEFSLLQNNSFGLSFPSIIACGKNATVLHYLKNDESLLQNKLVLMDFGARWGTMHADISRTLPVSGSFNPLQKLLYQIVLEATKFNQKNARAGVTINELNQKVWDFIEKKLETRFLKKGGVAQRDYTQKPHGVSHLMGEQEHDGDPFRLYAEMPLQVGWQISNEPGLYGHFSIELEGIQYSEYIGIRIEDNLLIRKNDSLNLSRSIPKEIKAIEKLIG